MGKTATPRTTSWCGCSKKKTEEEKSLEVRRAPKTPLELATECVGYARKGAAATVIFAHPIVVTYVVPNVFVPALSRCARALCRAIARSQRRCFTSLD